MANKMNEAEVAARQAAMVDRLMIQNSGATKNNRVKMRMEYTPEELAQRAE